MSDIIDILTERLESLGVRNAPIRWTEIIDLLNRAKELRDAIDNEAKAHAKTIRELHDARAELAALRHDLPYAQVCAELAALRAANAWIPVAERLPDDDIEVLVFITENCSYDIMYHNDNRWFADYVGASYSTTSVTHWRPLPEPPAGPEVEA